MPAPERKRETPERALASAASGLAWEDVPPEVRDAVRRLFLDWLGSALAGSTSAQATRLSRAVAAGGLMSRGRGDEGDGAGMATVLPELAPAPALVAALVNAASSHVLEMDDLHNASIYHPGTCIFPAALAVAEAGGAGPREFLTAAVAGYEVSLRVGEALGPEHYRYFHTTGTAGTFGAAVATGHLLGLDADGMLSALGSAGTQAAGLWQFLVRRHDVEAVAPGEGRLQRRALGVSRTRGVHGDRRGPAGGEGPPASLDLGRGAGRGRGPARAAAKASARRPGEGGWRRRRTLPLRGPSRPLTSPSSTTPPVATRTRRSTPCSW